MEGSGLGDFANQIVGLLVITFVAGTAWVALTVVIMRRASERRRRKREGLPNLPSFYSQAGRWVMSQMQGQSQQPTWEAPSAAPLPDLSALVSPLPTPDMNSLLGDIPTVPAPKPEPVITKAAEIAPPVVMQVKESAGGLPADAVEMMRIWRDLGNGSLIVEMRGQYFGSQEGLTGANMVDRFGNLIEELQKFAGIQPAVTAESPTKRSKARRPAKEEDLVETLPIIGMSMSDQIEELLQRNLLTHPEFSAHNIHVRPAISGGVKIEVDGTFYDAVSDVQDEDIRAFIQETIQEWEKRS